MFLNEQFYLKWMRELGVFSEIDFHTLVRPLNNEEHEALFSKTLSTEFFLEVKSNY